MFYIGILLAYSSSSSHISTKREEGNINNYDMRKFFITFTSLLSFSPIAIAQDSRLLSLNEAIEISLTNNPVITSAYHNEQVAIRERKAVRGLRMPQINITGNYTYLNKNIDINFNNIKQDFSLKTTEFIGTATQSGVITQQTSALIGGILEGLGNLDWSYTFQKQNFGFIGAEITMPIYLGGKINAAYRTAKLEEQGASLKSKQTENSLISEIIERYYALALATRVVQVREQVTTGIERHLRDAIALEKQGMIPHSERLYVEYKMAEAERNLQDARLKLATIRKALNTTLCTSEEFTATTPMFILNSIESVDFYKHIANNHNPILSQVELKKELSIEGVNIQRSQFFPQITAMGAANIYNGGVSNILPRWAIGVGVSFKLFDGLNRENRYLAAKKVAQEVEQIAIKAHDDINLLIEELYNQLLNYHNHIISINSSIRFAEEYHQAKEIAFKEGWTTASDLIDAELNLAKARIERLEAAFNYDVTLAKLLEASGISIKFTDYIQQDIIQTIK